MSLEIQLNGKPVEPSHVLVKKAKKGFSYGVAGYGASKVTAPSTVGPKEQYLKFDQSVKRGGTIGAIIGKKKRRSTFTRSTGKITAGKSRSR